MTDILSPPMSAVETEIEKLRNLANNQIQQNAEKYRNEFSTAYRQLDGVLSRLKRNDFVDAALELHKILLRFSDLSTLPLAKPEFGLVE